MTELTNIVECLHQAFRPKDYYTNIIFPLGWGNCTICKKDENNKYCKGYCPIRTYLFEVKK